MLKALFSLLFSCSLVNGTVQAQVVISDDSTATADPSAALDIQINGVSKKGVLLPRITQAQRLAIPSPAEGLLVIQTDSTPGVYIYLGGSWNLLGELSNGPAFITSYSPSTGIKDDEITIIGNEFDLNASNNSVTINGVGATVLSATRTQLVVRVPYSTDGNVVVTIAGNSTIATTPFNYQEPIITSITPTTARPGETIQVDGQYFDANPFANVVRFGTVAGTTTGVNAARNQLQVTVPLTGTDGPLTNTIQLNTSNGINFTYLKPTVTGVSGPGSVGQSIIITGTNFSDILANNVVTFPGDVVGTVTAATNTELVVTVPNSSSGNISVRVGSYTSSGFAFQYADPIVNSISPELGFVGTNITINGQFFDPILSNNEVSIGGVIASNVSVNSAGTSLIVKVLNTSFGGSVSYRRVSDNAVATGPVFIYAFATFNNVIPLNARAGEEITLQGSYFDPVASNNEIRIEGNLASIKSASSTQLVIYNPNFGPPGLITGLRLSDNSVILGFISVGFQDRLIGTFAGDGTSGLLNTSFDPLSAQFNAPGGAAYDETSNSLIIADVGNQCIRKINIFSGETSTIAGSTAIGFTNDADPLAASFFQPLDVAVDGQGNIYVADYGNHAIRKIAFDGTNYGPVTTLAGGGMGISGLSGYVDAAGATARFDRPYGIWSASSGIIFVADYANHVIRRIDIAGNVTTYAGIQTAPGTIDGAIARTSTFTSPIDVTGDAAGNLIVSDQNQGIRRIALAGGATTTLTNSFWPSYISTALDGSFWFGQNKRAYNMTSTGVVSIIAGTGANGYQDGSGQFALFNNITGIVRAGGGFVYICDQFNNRIRIISP